MLKSIRIALFTISWIMPPTALRCQNNSQNTFIWLFRQVDSYNGNVFLDTMYRKYDTVELKKQFPTELSKELKLLKLFPSRLLNLDFHSMPREVLEKSGSIETLYRKKSTENINPEDSLALRRSSDLFFGITKPFQGDSLRYIEDLLLESTYHRKLRNDEYHSMAKLMSVLGIFESEKFYLIVYWLTEIIGYPHSRVLSDLILK